MLNEKRIILMTRLQAYEDGPGKGNEKIADYFRGDYIGHHILISVINMTVSVLMLAGCYLLYHFEDVMKDMYQVDLVAIGKRVAMGYLISVVVYSVLTYIVYAVRYVKAKRSLKTYYGKLKKCGAMYAEEE